MKLLLDSHALIWWMAGDDGRLSAIAIAAIADPGNAVAVSAASAWEIAIKVKKGKLPGAAHLVATLGEQLAAERFSLREISLDHAVFAGGLEEHHHDPFDRMLIAQALLEGYSLVSNEEIFDRYGVARVW